VTGSFWSRAAEKSHHFGTFTTQRRRQPGFTGSVQSSLSQLRSDNTNRAYRLASVQRSICNDCLVFFPADVVVSSDQPTAGLLCSALFLLSAILAGNILRATGQLAAVWWSLIFSLLTSGTTRRFSGNGDCIAFPACIRRFSVGWQREQFFCGGDFVLGYCSCFFFILRHRWRETYGFFLHRGFVFCQVRSHEGLQWRCSGLVCVGSARRRGRCLQGRQRAVDGNLGPETHF